MKICVYGPERGKHHSKLIRPGISLYGEAICKRRARRAPIPIDIGRLDSQLSCIIVFDIPVYHKGLSC